MEASEAPRRGEIGRKTFEDARVERRSLPVIGAEMTKTCLTRVFPSSSTVTRIAPRETGAMSTCTGLGRNA